jgi:hypothetical protein
MEQKHHIGISRSQKNHTTLQRKRLSPGDRRHFWTCCVAKRETRRKGRRLKFFRGLAACHLDDGDLPLSLCANRGVFLCCNKRNAWILCLELPCVTGCGTIYQCMARIYVTVHSLLGNHDLRWLMLHRRIMEHIVYHQSWYIVPFVVLSDVLISRLPRDAGRKCVLCRHAA